MEDPIFPSLNGVRMRVVSTATNGVVNTDTIFAFRQQGRIVTCPYAGGRVVAGFLAGSREAAQLHWRYVQVTDAAEVESGKAIVDLSRTADGRLRLKEHFTWESKSGTGTNVFEEI